MKEGTYYARNREKCLLKAAEYRKTHPCTVSRQSRDKGRIKLNYLYRTDDEYREKKKAYNRQYQRERYVPKVKRDEGESQMLRIIKKVDEAMAEGTQADKVKAIVTYIRYLVKKAPVLKTSPYISTLVNEYYEQKGSSQ